MNDVLCALEIATLKKAQNSFILKLLSKTQINKVLKQPNFKIKGFKPRLLLDVEALVVASAEMKCLVRE